MLKRGPKNPPDQVGSVRAETFSCYFGTWCCHRHTSDGRDAQHLWKSGLCLLPRVCSTLEEVDGMGDHIPADQICF